MRILFTVCIWITCLLLAEECYGQTIVDSDWKEHNGLAVASSQTVVVPATKLRFFTTIESVEDEPRAAVENLSLHKKSAIAALKEIKIPDDSFKFAPTKIHEWEPKTSDCMLRGESYCLPQHGKAIPQERICRLTFRWAN